MGEHDLFGSISARLAHVMSRALPFKLHRFNGPRAIISFTFDDFPRSAATTGRALLERYEARGTFYAATSLIGTEHPLWEMATYEDMEALELGGHEIGLHTHTHRLAWQYDSSSFAADVTANRQAIEDTLLGYETETFAYPYGIGSIRQKMQLAKTVRAARSVHPGINAGLIDLHFLRAYELADARMTVERMRDLVSAAIARKGWLIFVIHDVSQTPTPYGVTPSLLENALREARQSGALILPINEALDKMGVPLLGA